MKAGFAMTAGAVLALSGGWASADAVKLPAGMTVELELQHHVTSGYVHLGNSIYFRVAKDVVVDNATLIRKGTLVTGRMEQATERGMAGRSGMMALGVRTLKAVDGADVQIACDLSKQGRSRSAAMVGWTLFWGIPGLMTRGVNPYIERGALLDAQVIAEVSIIPMAAPPTEAPAAAAMAALKVTGVKFAAGKGNTLTFDIERNKDLKTVDFLAELPPQFTDPGAALATVELVSVDGTPLPEQMRAISATAKSFTFDGWSLIKFCRDGITQLGFQGTSADGRALSGTYPVTIKIKKKRSG